MKGAKVGKVSIRPCNGRRLLDANLLLVHRQEEGRPLLREGIKNLAASRTPSMQMGALREMATLMPSRRKSAVESRGAICDMKNME